MITDRRTRISDRTLMPITEKSSDFWQVFDRNEDEGFLEIAVGPECEGFPGRSDGKESACNAKDLDLISGSGRSPGGRNGYPFQYSCLENPMGWAAWQATVHWVTKRRDWSTNTSWGWMEGGSSVIRTSWIWEGSNWSRAWVQHFIWWMGDWVGWRESIWETYITAVNIKKWEMHSHQETQRKRGKSGNLQRLPPPKQK